MTAVMTTYDRELLKRMAPAILERLTANIIKPTAEWSAWAAEWREEVPLTRQQKRENAEWRRRIARAKAWLEKARGDYEDAVEGIGRDFGVEVVSGGCGCDDGDEADRIDDSNPPHKTTYRTKPGAPEEPLFWPKVAYGPIKFTRTTDQMT